MARLLMLALFVLLVGSGVAIIIYADRQVDLRWQAHLALSAMITILITGVIAICAVAPWWMHR